MKKILIINGSRDKEGNTQYFISRILENISNQYNIEWIFPQDYTLFPIYEANKDDYHKNKDDYYKLEKEIENSNLLIVSSPVYMHNVSSDIKLLLERFSSWSHTLKLNGKPVIVLSTCESNGFNKVIEPLSQILTYMGGNVIATSNASVIKELHNEDDLKKISKEIGNRINEYINKPPQSNKYIEKTFQSMKKIMNYRINTLRSSDSQQYDSEEKYWIETELIKFDSFEAYIKSKISHK
ncbi:NAD(P)H-dependent oxidoreductase (plasmid) [Staphylococcus sp. HKU1]|uniref:flavodoxin family protein n=1 Tax=Staphylococcus sp. HKU1 TaxID=3068989 RepID=UPI003AADF88F